MQKVVKFLRMAVVDELNQLTKATLLAFTDDQDRVREVLIVYSVEQLSSVISGKPLTLEILHHGQIKYYTPKELMEETLRDEDLPEKSPFNPDQIKGPIAEVILYAINFTGTHAGATEPVNVRPPPKNGGFTC